MEFSAVSDGQLSLEFEHTRGEFTAALRAVMRRSRAVKVVTGIGSVLTAVGLLATLSGGDDGGWTVIGGSVLAWVAFMYLYCPLAQWRKEALFRGPRRLTFDEYGLGCITPLSETRVRWGFFTGMIETDRCYVLLRRAQCTPVPKAAFRSPVDVDRFRTLVAERITPGA